MIGVISNPIAPQLSGDRVYDKPLNEAYGCLFFDRWKLRHIWAAQLEKALLSLSLASSLGYQKLVSAEHLV